MSRLTKHVKRGYFDILLSRAVPQSNTFHRFFLELVSLGGENSVPAEKFFGGDTPVPIQIEYPPPGVQFIVIYVSIALLCS